MRTPALMLIGLVACDLAESPDTSTIDDETGGCETHPYLCANSAGYLHNGLHELSLLGISNTRGVRILPGPDGYPVLRQGTIDYRLAVESGEIIGRTATGGEIRGDAVIGADIPLIDDHDTPLYDIHIYHHRTIKYETPPITPLQVYVLTWHLPGYPPDPKQNACNTYKWPLRSSFGGMTADEVLLFAGDRIDPRFFTVAANPSDTIGWITFGCAGHALAKLDLSANTRHRQAFDDWEARQATLKMYVADYCGHGFAFTVPGTPLVWRGPTTRYERPPGELEARWTSSGAQCIGTPRLIAHPDPSFPLTPADIQMHCTYTPCVNLDVDSFQGATRISAN